MKTVLALVAGATLGLMPMGSAHAAASLPAADIEVGTWYDASGTVDGSYLNVLLGQGSRATDEAPPNTAGFSDTNDGDTAVTITITFGDGSAETIQVAPGETVHFGSDPQASMQKSGASPRMRFISTLTMLA
jgi:hypothetical protein